MKYSEVNIYELKCKDIILKLDRVQERLAGIRKKPDSFIELEKDGEYIEFKNWNVAAAKTGIPASTLHKIKNGELSQGSAGMKGYTVPDEYIFLTKDPKPKYTLIKDGKEEVFITQTEAAKHYNVNVNTIKRILTGKVCLGIGVVN